MKEEKEFQNQNESFGRRLQQMRKASGLSQEALAEKLEVSRQAVSKWENDAGFPETEKLLRLGELFQVSMDDLLAARAGKEAPVLPVQGDGRPAAEPDPGIDWPGWLAARRSRSRRFALGWGLLLGSCGLDFLPLDQAEVLVLVGMLAGVLFLLWGKLTLLPMLPIPLPEPERKSLAQLWRPSHLRGTWWLMGWAGGGGLCLLVLPLLADAAWSWCLSLLGGGVALGGLVYWGTLFRIMGRLLRRPSPWKG